MAAYHFNLFCRRVRSTYPVAYVYCASSYLYSNSNRSRSSVKFQNRTRTMELTMILPSYLVIPIVGRILG